VAGQKIFSFYCIGARFLSSVFSSFKKSIRGYAFDLDPLNCLKLFLLYYIRKSLFIFIVDNLLKNKAKKEIVFIGLGSGKSKERRKIHHCKRHEAKRLLSFDVK
jgi:hypothetical protein